MASTVYERENCSAVQWKRNCSNYSFFSFLSRQVRISLTFQLLFKNVIFHAEWNAGGRPAVAAAGRSGRLNY